MSRGKKSRSSSRRGSARRGVPWRNRCSRPGVSGPGVTLRSYQVGALPLVNRILERIRWRSSSEPICPPMILAVGSPRRGPSWCSSAMCCCHANPSMPWARGRSVCPRPVQSLGRAGGVAARRSLGTLFDTAVCGSGPELILAVVRHVIAEFQVGLENFTMTRPRSLSTGPTTRRPKRVCVWAEPRTPSPGDTTKTIGRISNNCCTR